MLFRSAVIVADRPVGVDLEAQRTVPDPGTAAELIAGGAARDQDEVLRAWVRSEARLKAGPCAAADAWSACWESCKLTVAGLVIPPLSGVFEAITGTYKALELRGERGRSA